MTSAVCFFSLWPSVYQLSLCFSFNVPAEFNGLIMNPSHPSVELLCKAQFSLQIPYGPLRSCKDPGLIKSHGLKHNHPWKRHLISPYSGACEDEGTWGFSEECSVLIENLHGLSASRWLGIFWSSVGENACILLSSKPWLSLVVLDKFLFFSGPVSLVIKWESLTGWWVTNYFPHAMYCDFLYLLMHIHNSMSRSALISNLLWSNLL